MIYGAARREIKCWFLKNWRNEFIAPISYGYPIFMIDFIFCYLDVKTSYMIDF